MDAHSSTRFRTAWDISSIIASKNYLNIDAIFVIFKRPIANRWYLICKKFIHNCALRTIDAKDSSDKQATANFVGLTWTCENTKVYLFICSFVNSRRVEHGAWSIVVDSISNVYPSIQPDYYDTKSRRGTRISYFRVFYRRLFSMLCESLQIVFWTVSFVCRIYIPSEHARSRAQLHTHTFYLHLHFHCAYTQHLARRRAPIVFLAHEDIVCELTDISGWIYHIVAIHASHWGIHILCKNNTRSGMNMQKCSYVVYYLEKNLI